MLNEIHYTYSKIKQMISASSSRKLVWPPGMWGLKPTLLTYVHSPSCPGKVPGGPTNSKHSTGKTYLDLRSWSLWNTCNCHSSVLYIQQVLELHQSQDIDLGYCVIHRWNKTEREGTKRKETEWVHGDKTILEDCFVQIHVCSRSCCM